MEGVTCRFIIGHSKDLEDERVVGLEELEHPDILRLPVVVSHMDSDMYTCGVAIY